MLCLDISAQHRQIHEFMQVFVYRSSRKEGAYVYLPKQDDFEAIPEAIRARLGRLTFALEFELTPDRRLATQDAAVVLANIAERGFHLQMPPAIDLDPMTEDWGTDA